MRSTASTVERGGDHPEVDHPVPDAVGCPKPGSRFSSRLISARVGILPTERRVALVPSQRRQRHTASNVLAQSRLRGVRCVVPSMARPLRCVPPVVGINDRSGGKTMKRNGMAMLGFGLLMVAMPVFTSAFPRFSS